MAHKDKQAKKERKKEKGKKLCNDVLPESEKKWYNPWCHWATWTEFNLLSKLSIKMKPTVNILSSISTVLFFAEDPLCHVWRRQKKKSKSPLSPITLLLLLAYNSARSSLRGNISGCYMGCLLLPREKYSNLKQLVGWQIVKGRGKKKP